jgi:hypothetical protein
MTVFAGPILLAEVAFRLPVRSEVTAAPIPNARDTARRYRQIFASYSHRDVAVVDAVEQYATLTGDRYLIDARTLRSGEVWDARLRQLIEEADIFQLFWSRNSMNSAFVKQEWEYALQLRREGFIRPVYWETPLAEDPDRDLPPAPLRRLHFSWLGAPPSSQGGPHPSTQATTPPVIADIAGDAGAVPAAPASPTMTVERPRNRRERSRRPGAGDLVCGECGETNPPARKFCRRCGTSLASAQHVAIRRRTLTRVAWAVTAAIVAIVGVAWWLAW